MGFQEGLGHVHGGAHDDRVGPEPDVHDGPVFLAECVEGLVWEGSNEVQVSYDGPWLWAWWQVVTLTAAEAAAEEDDNGKGCKPCGCSCDPTRRCEFNNCHLWYKGFWDLGE